ncbi:polysaccharide biosynthesis tyrosine autokinase [Novosphingobium sp. Chol11]|uniref:GumC family protein n=1 Tax=Novosphingobium sp. Chol11 TaxID=1385763 RepID=UPI0025EC72DC|nr:polysaccharide biosynthesis tyrosine autokinase [Novosphingobium sp. Chol11]
MQNQTSIVSSNGQPFAVETVPYGYEAIYDSVASGFDLRQIVATVRANLVLIGLVVAASLALAAVVTLLQTPAFTARTTLQINDQSAQILGKQDDISQEQLTSASDSERFLQTQMDILGSNAIAERVAKKLRLVGSAQFYDAMGLRQPDADLKESELKELTIEALLRGKAVLLPRNSRIATVGFTSTVPAFSARVANTWADEYIQANLQRRYDSSAYAREFISGQLNEARAKLENSERELNAYAREAGLIRTHDAGDGRDQNRDSGSGNSITTASLLQLNVQANQAQAARITAEQRWRSMSSGPLLSSPEVLANTAIGTLLAQRSATSADLERERARHLEDYPSVVQLKAQLASIDAQVQSVARNIRASVKQAYDSAREAEEALNQQVLSLKSSSLAEQDRLVQYNLLAREADTNRTVHDGLLQRYKELNAAAGISSSNIAIIDSADSPTKPSSPNLFRNFALALLAGVTLAGVIVFLRNQLDDAVRLPEDIDAKLNMPLLGVIPLTKAVDIEAMMEDPKSAISEAYNSLRSSLLYSSANGLPKTLLIASSQPSEGKSTTSLAMAIGLARLGRKVVLLDVDLRRPVIHRIVGVSGSDNAYGMSSLLTSQGSIEDALKPTDHENLTVITAGPIPLSPTELLSSGRMKQILEELSERFDVVILDSPPVLGLADAPLMAALVEGVILVVQSDRSRRGSLKSSLRRLRGMRPNILGGVLTMFDASKNSNAYSEYYGYNYYQYDAKTNA